MDVTTKITTHAGSTSKIRPRGMALSLERPGHRSDGAEARQILHDDLLRLERPASEGP